jgi:hypothetical protein
MEKIKYNEAIASLMQDKNKRDELAELLVEFIDPGHITTDFVGMLLNSRAMKEGDALVKKVRKGINVRTLVPGTVHLADEFTIVERLHYSLDGADIKVTASEWELNSGELGTIEKIREEMLKTLKDYYQNKVFAALTSVWTAGNTPDNYAAVATAVTSTALETAIQQISQTIGGPIVVAGVRSVLNPITKFGAFWDNGAGSPTVVGVDSQLEEVMQSGMLGRYYGAEIIVIDQAWDYPDTYNALIPTNKILVMAKNVGEFITYGDIKEKQYTDPRPTPPQWFFEIYQQFGMIIDRAEGIYVIEIT